MILGFRVYEITTSKKESVATRIIKTFSNENTLPKHTVLGHQIHLYFPKHKLTIEVDEKGHTDGEKKMREN